MHLAARPVSCRTTMPCARRAAGPRRRSSADRAGRVPPRRPYARSCGRRSRRDRRRARGRRRTRASVPAVRAAASRAISAHRDIAGVPARRAGNASSQQRSKPSPACRPRCATAYVRAMTACTSNIRSSDRLVGGGRMRPRTGSWRRRSPRAGRRRPRVCRAALGLRSSGQRSATPGGTDGCASVAHAPASTRKQAAPRAAFGARITVVTHSTSSYRSRRGINLARVAHSGHRRRRRRAREHGAHAARRGLYRPDRRHGRGRARRWRAATPST